MDVILKEDVPGLGRKGDIVKVKDGYGRNYLIPKGLAVPATSGKLKEQSFIDRAKADKESRLLREASEAASKIQDQKIVFKVKAGKGRIFGSVTAPEIAKKLQSKCKVSVDKRKVLLDENLKELGTHEVFVQLHPEVRVKIIVDIQPEEDQ